SRKHESNDALIGQLELMMEKVVKMEKTVAQLKFFDKVSVSNLSEKRIGEILNRIGVKQTTIAKEDFEKFYYIQYPSFEWGVEAEAQQMEEVVRWFNDALKLPRGFNVWDIHTDVYHQREIKSANVILTGGSEIAIGPRRTYCIWIEARKSMARCIKAQAIGELLLLDNNSALNPLVVLTDCNDFWDIFFIKKRNDENHIVRCTMDRSLALAVIKQFVIEEGNRLGKWIGDKTICVSGDVIEPLRRKAKIFY
ncbi:17995_t:CDS:2, partial [Acaulospora morrowiae]